MARQRPRPGSLVGIGVGPGDPEAVTLAAIPALRRAGRVMAPSLAADAVGRAESIVRQVTPDVAVERLVFDMSISALDRRGSDRSAPWPWSRFSTPGSGWPS